MTCNYVLEWVHGSKTTLKNTEIVQAVGICVLTPVVEPGNPGVKDATFTGQRQDSDDAVLEGGCAQHGHSQYTERVLAKVCLTSVQHGECWTV